ncbi:Uncharacterized protein dnl_07350 [Desulfonema limicola]|uniref:Uncharacterized protein n=1 Tax=Desulfonema limicola TaxID=45656 RepID=A0A975B4A3_9BACT|nr:Uncharacterized protein dnl_07350 [Desulfonema limicola]
MLSEVCFKRKIGLNRITVSKILIFYMFFEIFILNVPKFC